MSFLTIYSGNFTVFYLICISNKTTRERENKIDNFSHDNNCK